MKKILKIFYIFIATFFIFNGITLCTPNLIYAKENNILDFVILFKENSIDKNVEKIITDNNGQVINEFSELGGIKVRCSTDLIPIINSQNTVQSLTANKISKLSDTEIDKYTNLKNPTLFQKRYIADNIYDTYQWDIKRITNNWESLKIESGNHNVVVGIIDSGVDINHPDLVGNLLGGKNFVPANFQDDETETGDENDINDRIGHGTNVAGFIAANGEMKGVAPNIGFKSYRVFNENGETDATICTSAILAAVNDGVKVINLSMGTYDLKGKCYWVNPNTGVEEYLGDDMAEYSLYKRAIKYAIKQGVTVVSAAGNEGMDCANKKELTNYLNEIYGEYGFRYEGLTYEVPGTIKGVITVSATDNDDKLASYSNFGDDFIDIAAPGGSISNESLMPSMCFTTDIDSSYTFTQGTSFSAPKVSAVAALIICQDGNISPKSIAKKIYKTADRLENNKLKKYYGAGIVNAYNALNKK